MPPQATASFGNDLVDMYQPQSETLEAAGRAGRLQIAAVEKRQLAMKKGAGTTGAR